jgi:hypothetical protein
MAFPECKVVVNVSRDKLSAKWVLVNATGTTFLIKITNNNLHTSSNHHFCRGHYKPRVEALTKCVQMLEEALASVQQPQGGNQTAGTMVLNPVGQPISPLSIPQVVAAGGQGHWHGAMTHPDAWSEPGTAIPIKAPPPPLSHSIISGEDAASGYFDQPESHFSPGRHPEPPPSHGFTPSLSPLFTQESLPSADMGQNRLLRCVTLAPERRFAYPDHLGLSSPVVDYLLGLFFHRYQLMLKFVSQHDFMAQKALGHGPAFRPSLMLAMLAAGLRYSTREEVTTAYLRPDGENILGTAAKKALETELRSSSITTVQSLLIMTEVETSLGNDMTGYLYSSMASKLIFNLQLHAGSSPDIRLSDDELDRRHWLIWAASVADQYWAVSLRRPLAIKSHTIQTVRLAARFAQNGHIDPHVPSLSSFEHQVNESLLDLMELAREVTESLYGSGVPPQDAPTMVSKLHQRLEGWHNKLPDKMRRGPAGGEDSYHFLFVLHLLFNVVKIVLHQDMVRTAAESRTICAVSATQIAKLFEIFRRREDIRTLQCTGVQWATVATNALIQHISLLPVEETIEALAHLQSLGRTLKEMTNSFQPAIQPYEDSCSNVQLFLSRLNEDNGSKRQVPIPSTPVVAPPPPNINIPHPQRMDEVQTRMDTPKASDISSSTIESYYAIPEMNHMSGVPLTPRSLQAESMTIPCYPMGTCPAAGSWSDSYEWEDIMGQS